MYEHLNGISPWIIVVVLTAVIVLLLALTYWCLRLSENWEEGKAAELTELSKLRQVYHSRVGHHTVALIYIDISLHRMRNRHSDQQAAEGYRFIRGYLHDRVAAHYGGLITQVDGKNLLILSEDSQEDIDKELKKMNQSLQQYAADHNVINMPEINAGYYAVTSGIVDFDEAVYRVRQVCKQAAESGRNFCVYDYEKLRRQEMREQLEELIERYIRENRFYLEFQPFIEIDSRQIIGGEALARMRPREWGDAVMPDQFLQAIESVGCQWKFDCYIFDKCCAWLACQTQRSLRYISCNFSRISISRPDFAQMVMETAERYKLDHSRIGIEITEEEQVRSDTVAGQCLAALHQAGFRILLDDFGTGVTAFTDLRKYPIDEIKIDRELLCQAREEKGSILYCNLVRMAKELGYSVLCEGVETSEQMALVKRSGADSAQGYYYYPPLSAEEFERLIGSVAIAGAPYPESDTAQEKHTGPSRNNEKAEMGEPVAT